MTKFADIQILRYELPGWETLSLREKQLVYCLSEATIWGRDITFDQFGAYNLRIRKTLEAILLTPCLQEDKAIEEDMKKLKTYLQRVWFSSGIYHHYSCQKFLPEFSEEFFASCVRNADASLLPLRSAESVEDLIAELTPVMFDPELLTTRVNHKSGDDLVVTSANTFYQGVTQKEAEEYYERLKREAVADGMNEDELPSFGLNTRLRKDTEGVQEDVYFAEGLYGKYINKIVYWLERALEYADDAKQKEVIETLISYYKTGDLRVFDDYSIKWVSQTEPRIDFINGFIEVYADPLGLKGSWEGIVHFKDLEATHRAQTLSTNAQWFEDHSPVDPRFRKPQVKGVTANVVCAAMLGGDEYPSTAIGINLPNADWIRASHGSKSITISNLTAAYDKASEGSGFREEFVPYADVREMIHKYGHHCDDLHTDLHECLGHGSGQILPGVSPDALRSYGSTIEEARADLFGLYYIADPKLVELGLLPDDEAYKSQYYTYLLNGLMTQSVRIPLGEDIQEAHMRNRALIAGWVYEHAEGAVELVQENGKTALKISDYAVLRTLFAQLLAEIQRIKSEGDHEAAKAIVEKYGVKLNPQLHKEMRTRYESLHIAPYKGFLNPVYTEVKDENGVVVDVKYDLTEEYDDQMLRYGKEYSF